MRGEEGSEVFRAHHTDLAWQRHAVDLSEWSGQTITLRFMADCGPDDNTVADHVHWGDVMVLPGDVDDSLPDEPPFAPDRIMAWAGREWSEASF